MTIDECRVLFRQHAREYGLYLRTNAVPFRRLIDALEDNADCMHSTATTLLDLQETFSMGNKMLWYVCGPGRFRVRHSHHAFCDQDGDIAYLCAVLKKDHPYEWGAGGFGNAIEDADFHSYKEAAQYLISQLIVMGAFGSEEG